jgi:hypothetical protein
MKYSVELKEAITVKANFSLSEIDSQEADWKRKYEELERCLNRIKKFYDGLIVSESGEDSLQSPKDFARNFFRVSYELKEALKHESVTNISPKIVEKFCKENPWTGLGIDIANQTKHGWWNVILNHRKTNKKIGKINTGIHFLSSDGRRRTELSIEIDDKKEDCLCLAQRIFDAWRNFLEINKLINKGQTPEN